MRISILLLAALLAGFALAAPGGVARAAENDPPRPTLALRLFDDEAAARAHCPADTVLRIDLPDGFFLHGDRGFGGVSLDHVFVCRDEAARAFARPNQQN